MKGVELEKEKAASEKRVKALEGELAGVEGQSVMHEQRNRRSADGG